MVFCQAQKAAMLPAFDERKGGDGLRGEQNRDTLLKNAEKFYFALTSGKRSAILLNRNKENVRYGRFSVDKRSGKSFIDSRCYTI